MKLSFSTRGWPNLSWEEMIDTALDMGFGGIEVYNLPKFDPMLEKGGRSQKLINLAGNVLIFVPLGFLPPLLWKKWRHFWATLPLCAGVSLLIEFLQLFLGRSVDVDDLILNTLGGLMGYILFCLIPKKWR